MNRRTLALLSAALCLSCLVLSAPGGGGAAPRHKYSKWEYNKDKGYYYRTYEYKVTPSDVKYEHQYIVYYKDDPKKKKWVYIYNPKTEKYWARYPTIVHSDYGADVKAGKELWSVLPKDGARRFIDEIDPASFSKPGETCPTIPGCPKMTPMMPPPGDLP